MSFTPDDAFETVYDNVEDVNLVRVDDDGTEHIYGPIRAVRDNELHELREVGEQRLWFVSMSWHLKAGAGAKALEAVLDADEAPAPFSIEHGDIVEAAFDAHQSERWFVEAAAKECLGTEWIARTYRKRPGGGL